MDRDSGFAGRLEIVETGRRRRWSIEEKIRIVEESLSGDRQASATVRRHSVPDPLLFRWRKAYREGRLGEGLAPAAASFVPAVITEAAPSTSSAGAPGWMEIVLRCGRRVKVGGDVDAAALRRVLDVLEGRS